MTKSFLRTLTLVTLALGLAGAPTFAQDNTASDVAALSRIIQIESLDTVISEAFTTLKAAADAGDAAAALAVGRSLFSNPDPEIQREGVAYIQRAADGGMLEAMLLMGDLYSNGGYGVIPDLAKARFAYEAALDAGSSDAISSLARLLLNSDFSPEGQNRAVELLEKAVNSGQISAANTLGQLYLDGRGVPADSNRALYYFGIGLISSNGTSRAKVANILREGSLNVAANPAAAMQFFQSAAQAGDRGAARTVADMTLRGEGVSQDFDRATQLLSELAQAGDSEALIDLGDIYSSGEFATENAQKAIGYFESSASLGNSTALIRLGQLYLSGAPGVSVNNRRALEYFNEAAKRGNNSARRQLAELYLEGKLVAADPQRAVDLLKTGAQYGDSRATEQLAILYASNGPFPADYSKVKDYLDLSLLMGNTDAVLNVAQAVAEGPLARLHRDDVFVLLDGAVKGGVKGAAARLAKLQLEGLFPAKGLQGVISMLNDAAHNGDQTSARYLLELYRDGYGLLMRPDMDAAVAFLTTMEPVLGKDGTIVERIKLLAMTNESIDTLEAISAEYGKLSKKKAISTLDSLRRINANAYVYVLQERLAQRGLYTGALNGRLDAVTIKAFQAACIEANAARECAPGPLTSATGRILANITWTPSEGALAAQ